MAGSLEGGGEWLLLSMAVARMSELHPNYRTFPGIARRDLENAIWAGRAVLRGHSIATRSCPPVPITGLITSKHRLDLIHNTISRHKPGPLGDDTLFRDVEIEWTEVAKYLRAFAVETLNAAMAVTARSEGAAVSSNKAPSKRPRQQPQRERARMAL